METGRSRKISTRRWAHKQVFSTAEASEILSTSPRRVRELVRWGHLDNAGPRLGLGRKVLVTRESIDRLLAEPSTRAA